MDIAELTTCLQYTDSACYLSGARLDAHPGYTHIFRRAREKCGLRGVYTLKAPGGLYLGKDNVVPLVYVCEAYSEAEAMEIHKLAWNQNAAPFLIISTPGAIRLYPGFKYNTKTGEDENQALLTIAGSAAEVLKKLSDFKADAIDSGAVWKKWEKEVAPDARVDAKLLKSLKALGNWLRLNGLSRGVSHALIGKYVYLHYLKDRKILSDRKLEQWSIPKESVFGRGATREGFHAVADRLDAWLNGTIFPIPGRGERAPTAAHIRKVAATFLGDAPESGQMHLDFKAYDFEHIPIETLSMVYQQFLHAEGKGRGRGAFYTPVYLVNFILDELEARRPLKKGMKVFDPACGSGAFLVQCFRRLMEREIARAPGRNLNPSDSRRLLTDHIYGLDVDEDACGVTELSLILTLLDYIDPPDLEKNDYKRFKLPVLRDRNIFYRKGGFFNPGSGWRKVRPKAGYDWIVGNPPWKRLNARKPEKGDMAALDWIRANKTSRPVSDNQIAEAFAWEVTNYISKKGLIGLLMPAATLFKKRAEKFREKFFGGMPVWCVVNFANLRHMLFRGASNPASAFFYAKPRTEAFPRSRGIMTYTPFAVNQLNRFAVKTPSNKNLWTVLVNADEICEISLDDAASGSNLPWKTGMWASTRDRRLLSSMAKYFAPLSKFAEDHNLSMHEGLQLRNRDSKESMEPIHGLEAKKILDMTALRGCGKIFIFPEKALQPIGADRSYVRKGRGKKPLKVCNPPHIVVDAARRFAVYSDEFFVIPPRQIGIAGAPGDADLLKALTVYLNSDFALYHQFLSSTLWGVERDRPNKSDLEQLPVPLDALSPAELGDWASLHDELVKASSDVFKDPAGDLFKTSQKGSDLSPLLARLNDAVYAALGIDETERWLIQDLSRVRMRLNEGKIAVEATRPSLKSEMEEYAAVLKSELDHFLDEDIIDQHRVTVFYTDQSATLKIEHPEDPPAGRIRVVEVKGESGKKEFEDLNLSLTREQGQWIYFNRNLKIFQGRTTYFMKPRHRLCWLKSQALLDADEFIAEKLTFVL